MLSFRALLPIFLAVLLVAACSFPDAAVWRAAAYTEISAAQLDSGNVEAARLSAGEAVRAAEEARDFDYENWAAAAAAAALARFGSDDPDLGMFLADLELDTSSEDTLTLALLLASLVAADRGDFSNAATYATRLDASERPDLYVWAKARLDPLQAVLDARTADVDSQQTRSEILAFLAYVAARNGNPELAMDILVRNREELATVSGGELPILVLMVDGLVSGVRESYRDMIWAAIAEETRIEGSDEVFLIALETAFSYARRDGMIAADRALAEIESSDDRVKAYALLAHRLAVEGRLPAARVAAATALDLLRLSGDIIALDEAMVVRELPGLFPLAGETIPIAAGDDTTTDAAEPFGREAVLALVRTSLGDRTGAALVLDDIETGLMSKADSTTDSQTSVFSDMAHFCWLRVLIGDIHGALDLAWRIDDPDYRAFALLPVVAALAQRGDFAAAQDLAVTMVH